MASDGCQEVAWKGKAFPYLMHRPDPVSHSYAENRGEAAGVHTSSAPSAGPVSDVHKPAASGTWNGPAPKGQLAPEQRGTAVAPQSAARPQPRDTRLGSARLPMLILGTDQCPADDAEARVAAALAAGVRAFDCDQVSGTATKVGAALAKFGGKREELFVISKIWNDAKRPEALKEAAQQAVQDLQCGYLDLLLLHWPKAWKPGTQEDDPDATLDATWAAMEELVASGVARQLGVANFGLAQVEALLDTARACKPVCNMAELHPRLSQRKLVGTLLRKGVQCVASHPVCDLGGEAAKTLEDVASSTGQAVEAVLVKWNVQRGLPTVIADVQHVKDADTFFSWKLDEEHAKLKLDALDAGERCVQPEWATFAGPEEGGAAKPSAVLYGK